MSEQRRVPSREFLIARRNEGRTKPGQFRVALDQIGEERLDGGAIGEFAGFFGYARNILEPAKE